MRDQDKKKTPASANKRNPKSVRAGKKAKEEEKKLKLNHVANVQEIKLNEN